MQTALSAVVADEIGLPIIPVKANWNQFGRAAGPLRNTEMLIGHQANGVVAFHYDLSKSKGTANMVLLARKYGRPVWICTQGEDALLLFIRRLKGLGV